jgi:hypothetical protein
VTKGTLELARPAAQHAEPGVQSDAVATLLERALAKLASGGDPAAAGESDCLADRRGGPVIDRGNGIHDDCLE